MNSDTHPRLISAHDWCAEWVNRPAGWKSIDETAAGMELEAGADLGEKKPEGV